ncbi:MAG: hypothetical protein H0W06_05630, partial [Chloroflexia bacterium]|nr:hypothetical protein [Chloroflexia bacterium]
MGRRTFLKAAALGTAAAALVHGGTSGLRFGALSALADDLSTFQCTANDVRIIGAGQIINEPCDCPGGTFNAEVQFTVENNAASDRGCITLHLVPAGPIPNQLDVILQGSIPGKTTQVMTGFINNYPCGSGLVCFGSAEGDGRRRCDAGQCSTVSWTVPGQDSCPPDKQISSKCRHQRICIQGRGGVSLDCDTSVDGVQDNCPVPCGGFKTLRLSAIGGVGPFTYSLSDGQEFGPTDVTSHDFEVGPVTENTDYTGSVTDGTGCTKSDEVRLTTTAITPEISVTDTDNCNGVVTVSTSVAGFEGCSFAYTIDGDPAANVENDTTIVRVNSNGTLSYRNLDNTCHTIGVTAT